MREKVTKIEIEIHVLRYSKKLQYILTNFLDQVVKTYYGKDVKTELIETKQYWKISEETKCIFALKTSRNIKVKDIIKLFPIKWEYFCLPSKNDSKICDVEEAIWSSDVSKETFINKNITWVYIFACT